MTTLMPRDPRSGIEPLPSRLTSTGRAIARTHNRAAVEAHHMFTEAELRQAAVRLQAQVGVAALNAANLILTMADALANGDENKAMALAPLVIQILGDIGGAAAGYRS